MAEDPDAAFKAEAKAFCIKASDWLKEHEDDEHDGEPCFDERGNLLAYIAHMIGADHPEAIDVMLDRIVHYRLDHLFKRLFNGDVNGHTHD